MKHLLFLCSRDRRRSPTAERDFAGWPGIGTAPAGLALDGVDLVAVMERARRSRLRRRFGSHLRRARVVCLDVPDHHALMAPALVALLVARAGPHLARLTGAANRTVNLRPSPPA